MPAYGNVRFILKHSKKRRPYSTTALNLLTAGILKVHDLLESEIFNVPALRGFSIQPASCMVRVVH
jgi:hypothetical protein